MKTAIYLRVSTNHQTTDNQIPDIENYLESHSIAATDVTWYRENETAWTQGHTAELAKLKEEIRSGKRKFELFIVWAFDRLTREGSIALIREYDFFIRHGVKVISIKEGWSDVPKEFTPVMLAMFGYLAEMESKRKSERIKAGNARKAKDGKWRPGRQLGAKDKPGHRRDRTGYLLRYAKKTNKVPTTDTLELPRVNQIPNMH